MKIFAAGLLNYLWNGIITHIPWHAFRKTFLRLFNRRISSSSVVLMHVRLLNFWSLELGDRSVLNQYVLIDCRRYKVKIANDVDIGPYTKIWTLGHDPDSPVHEVKGGEVHVEDHVWIASGVTVLPDVILSRGSVVSAGSIVTKSIPPLEIWGGIPARKIRGRQNELGYQLCYTPYLE